MKRLFFFLFPFVAIPFLSGSLHGQNAADIGSYASSLFFVRSTINYLEDFSEVGLQSEHSWSGGFQFVDHEVKGEAGRPVKSSYQGGDLSFGYFQPIQDFQVGVLVGMTDIQLESLPDAGNNNFFINELQGDGWSLALVGSRQWDRWTATAILGMGGQSLEGTRRFTEDSPNPPLPKTSAFDVSLLYARASVHYLFMDTPEWKNSGYFSFGYDLMEADGFDEVDVTGNAGDDVRLESFEDEVPFAELGVNFLYQGMENIVPSLRIALVQDLGDDIIELPWSNGPFSVVSEVNDPTQTSFSGQFSVQFDLGEAWTLTPLVKYISSDQYSGTGGNLFLNYRF